MTSRHQDRCVVVTGSASGIGTAIARSYCEEGARVGLVDRDAAALAHARDELERDGHRVAAAVADIGSYGECEAACREVARLLGPIDTLVNNAGISPKHNGKAMPFHRLDPAEWTRVIDVNLHGSFNMARVLAPEMVERRFGRIVNTSSVAGKAYLDVGAAHYAASKAAIIGFTRHLAGDLGFAGITVNAVAPGRIDTPLVRGAATGVNDLAVSQTPLGRLGTPREVAQCVCFLTSAEANFITGQVVDVAGGWLMT
jgi:3-oxoacyl-[acyl-carrier protein] reductase